MVRFIVLLLVCWIFFDFINVILVGLLSARLRADEETKKHWFVFALLGGPIFTVIAFLMYFMRSSERYYQDVERKEVRKQMKEDYRDIFEDEA